jgi:hypothetical protein
MQDINADNDNQDSSIDPDEKMQLLDRAITMLSEHFDNIQILASSIDENGDTLSFQRGRGNWHARLGQMRAFLICQDESYREQERINLREGNEYEDP